MKKNLILFFIVLGFIILNSQFSIMDLHASGVTIDSYVDKNRVSVGETFRFTIEVKGESIGSLPVPELPPMSFTVLGSSRGSSSHINFVNGRMTSQKSESITFTLRAETAGNFRIPPVSVVVDRQQFMTNMVEITVQSGNTQAQTQQGQTGQTQTQAPQTPQRQSTDGSETFLLAIVDKTSVYRNEMIIVHYKLYTQSQLQNVTLGGEPTFSGFWKEELYQAERLQMQREVYEGRQYFTLLIRSIALFPSREGNLAVPTFDLNLDIVVPARSFWDFASSRQMRVSSRSVNIRVNPLPTPEADKEFVGAVGNFDVTSSISANEGEAGGTLTYRITISGTGNFNQVLAPKMPEIQGIRFLSPETEDRRNQSATTFSGRRTFVYPILLQESGTIDIPEIEITWFNPAQRRYVSRTLKSETIFVRPSSQQIVTTPGSQQTIRVIGHDIQFIITKLSSKSFAFLYQRYWFWLVLLTLILSLLMHHLYILEINKQSADVLYKRSKRASNLIRKYLKEASIHAKRNSIEFYNSAYTGISQFLTDKLNLPRGSIEKVIIDALKDRNVHENLIEELQKVYAKINFVKFSNSSNTSVNIKEDLAMIDRLITALVKEIKKGDNKK